MFAVMRTQMVPYLAGVWSLLLFFAAAEPQTSPNSSHAPTVSIALPKDINSEAVQIRYFMSGSFGGYGGGAGSKPDLRSYQIETTVQGQPAQSIRILVYASGCRIQTFVMDLSENQNLEQQFVCEPLPMITFKGQVPADLIKDEHAEVVVIYTAFWAQEFFGIMDGFVTQLQVASAKPDADGCFELDIPDFSADTSPFSYELSATLGLVLRNSVSLNPIAGNLEPELPELRTPTNALRIQATYPSFIRFVPSPN